MNILEALREWMVLFGQVTWFLMFLEFMFGATLASGINCFWYRHFRRMSWVRGRSVCEHCGRTLVWYELIPVFSSLCNGGRCRSCKFAFGLKHVWKEVLLGVSIMICITCGIGNSFATNVLYFVMYLSIYSLLSYSGEKYAWVRETTNL